MNVWRWMHHKRKSEISHLYAKNVTRFSDQVHPLDITIGSHRVSKRKKEKEKIEKWWIDREKKRQRKREREREREMGREARKKQKLHGYICFRHFLLLIPPLKAQRTPPEIPYARCLSPPPPGQFPLFLFYRQFTLHSLPSPASLLLTDQS